jgi:cellulose synthase/poly-beta-1,6-N-acetylglucosamine synthase-like glycosyltransferase
MKIVMATLFWLSVLFIIYTYFGYPVLIAILAKLKTKSEPYPISSPFVTFIIAAYNEEVCIGDKLDNTLALDYPHDKLQIIVAADGSSDQTPSIVKAYSDCNHQVELSYIPARNGKMAAISRAVSQAQGEIVIVSDANNTYDDKAIRKLVAPFIDETVGLTTGAKIIIEDGNNLSSSEGLYWKYESSIKENETILGTCTVAVGEILALRRDLFIPPEKSVVLDDQYLVLSVLRQGYRVIYTPEARSFEYVSQTAKDEVERRLKINAGLYQMLAMSGKLFPFNRPFLIWQLLSHKFFRVFVPFAMIISFVSNLALAVWGEKTVGGNLWLLVSPFWRIILVLQVTFYLLAVLGNIISVRGLLGKILYLPTFLVNSNMATIAGLYSFATNKNPHIWKRVRR